MKPRSRASAAASASSLVFPTPWLAPDDKRAARAFDFAEERSQKSYLIVPTEQAVRGQSTRSTSGEPHFCRGHATRLRNASQLLAWPRGSARTPDAVQSTSAATASRSSAGASTAAK